MKIKHYKILTLLSIGFITAFTTAPTLQDVQGALTAPTSYDYSYTYDGLFTYELNTSPNYVYYTRTADGIYYNYTTTREIISGLEVTMTFNRSNTSWAFISGSPGGYTPTDTKIGSNNTVGSLRKTYLEFDNQTTNNYFLYYDFSSSGTARVIDFFYDTYETINYYTDFYMNHDTISVLFIPSFTKLILHDKSNAGARYLDAWYLKDLGVSASYDAGVDFGFIQGQDEADLLVTGFSAMVGILVNFALMIVNLEVFGVSLMGIFAIVVLLTGIVWTLKLIRG